MFSFGLTLTDIFSLLSTTELTLNSWLIATRLNSNLSSTSPKLICIELLFGFEISKS
ncbi:hypothetical protein [Ureaplasma parvum]|uniref:hypothetical protein n=1 Tax=Ureaplasma parvum TaxID=134821 RepID=UPI001E285712|nr:hypothetical protein [Ureaplasma parvum]